MVKWVDRPGIESIVGALLKDIVIRHRFEDCVDIPANHRYSVPYTLTKSHRNNYAEMEKEQLLLLKNTVITAINGGVVYTKLLQIASGAVYDAEGNYQLLDTGRYELVLDLVEARQHSVVFFNWQHQRDLLAAEADRRGLNFAIYDGATKKNERVQIVKDFQAGLYDVLFAHPQSAGHGLTLTKGTATIWASPTPNLEHFAQGWKRVHRIGQTEKTETIVVVAKDTVDEKVWMVLNEKDGRMSALLDELRILTS
jgi:SNF2 family DNA or RNA helicase